MMKRQGDILILKVNNFDESKISTQVERENGAVVLAYGEVTNHCHQIISESATLFNINGSGNDRLLKVIAPVNLVHEEHGTIPLEPGSYLVRRQREFHGLVQD